MQPMFGSTIKQTSCPSGQHSMGFVTLDKILWHAMLQLASEVDMMLTLRGADMRCQNKTGGCETSSHFTDFLFLPNELRNFLLQSLEHTPDDYIEIPAHVRRDIARITDTEEQRRTRTRSQPATSVISFPNCSVNCDNQPIWSPKTKPIQIPFARQSTKSQKHVLDHLRTEGGSLHGKQKRPPAGRLTNSRKFERHGRLCGESLTGIQVGTIYPSFLSYTSCMTCLAHPRCEQSKFPTYNDMSTVWISAHPTALNYRILLQARRSSEKLTEVINQALERGRVCTRSWTTIKSEEGSQITTMPSSQKSDHRNGYQTLPAVFDLGADDVIYIVGDECSNFGGCIKTNNLLKNIATSSSMKVEHKGINRRYCSNYRNVTFLANGIYVVRVEKKDDRRPWVCGVPCNPSIRGDCSWSAIIVRSVESLKVVHHGRNSEDTLTLAIQNIIDISTKLKDR